RPFGGRGRAQRSHCPERTLPSGMVVSQKSPDCRSAPVRLALRRLVPRRLAPARSALVRSAPGTSAPDRSAPEKLAPARLAPDRLAPAKLELAALTPRRSTPVSCAYEKSRPRRSPSRYSTLGATTLAHCRCARQAVRSAALLRLMSSEPVGW